MTTQRNTSSIKLLSIAALVAAMSGSAFAGSMGATSLPSIDVTAAAQSGNYWVFEGDGLVSHAPFVSTKTRDEVRAEFFASRARGDYVFVGDGLQPRSDFKSTLTRAEVLAELDASRARGDYVFVGDGLQPRAIAANAPAQGQIFAAK